MKAIVLVLALLVLVVSSATACSSSAENRSPEAATSTVSSGPQPDIFTCEEWEQRFAAGDEVEIVSQSGDIFQIVNHTQGTQFTAKESGSTTAEDKGILEVWLNHVETIQEGRYKLNVWTYGEASVGAIGKVAERSKDPMCYEGADQYPVLTITVDTPLPDPSEITPVPPNPNSGGGLTL